ncbi:MAG: hypothetical protein ABH871_02580 [Pseudomonadota bacterium]
MSSSRILAFFLAVIFVLPMITNCAKDETRWGQKLDPDKKWWKKEGQSWERMSNIFMTIGYSNPDWKDKYDMRKSADLDARSQVATFMQSLVKNYMEEVRSRNYAISESIIESSADETITGSVIVARHYGKSGKHKGYQSLIKVDLTNFFRQIDKEYGDKMAENIRKKNRSLNQQKLDELIKEKMDAALEALNKSEEPAVEKTLENQ